MLLLVWDAHPALETVAVLAINHAQMDALVVVADVPVDVLAPAFIHVDLDAQHLRKHKGGEKKGLYDLRNQLLNKLPDYGVRKLWRLRNQLLT